MLHMEFTVKGKVQGVFFRKYAKEKALDLSLKGFVQNTPEGYVYIRATGDAKSLNDFGEWLYTGSPFSEVSEVVAAELKEAANYKSFIIRRN